MIEKLNKDSSETRMARHNLISTCIGTVLFLMSIACLFIKAASGEYVDADGWLHESFFIVLIAFLLFFCGFLTFLVIGIRNIIELFCKRSLRTNKTAVIYLAISLFAVISCIVLFVLLRISNT